MENRKLRRCGQGALLILLAFNGERIYTVPPLFSLYSLYVRVAFVPENSTDVRTL